jgi:hypothetical protein
MAALGSIAAGAMIAVSVSVLLSVTLPPVLSRWLGPRGSSRAAATHAVAGSEMSAAQLDTMDRYRHAATAARSRPCARCTMPAMRPGRQHENEHPVRYSSCADRTQEGAALKRRSDFEAEERSARSLSFFISWAASSRRRFITRQ